MTNEVKLASEFPVLETERFLLRQGTMADAPGYFAIFSNPDVTKYYDLETFTELAQAEDLLRRAQAGYEEHKRIRWIIVPKGEDAMIGSIGFHSWDKGDFKAEIGYELRRERWGQGVIAEVMPFVLAYGFQHLQLNRVEAQFHPLNSGSRRVLEKAGFQREGLLRDYAFMKGQFLDVEVYSLLKREFVK